MVMALALSGADLETCNQVTAHSVATVLARVPALNNTCSAAGRAGGLVSLQNESTPLYMASQEGHIHVVVALLDLQANVNARNKVSI